jgi:TusA-related sulfurtransferase
MSQTVDARGLSCPQPVLMALDAIKKSQETEMEVFVDTEASRENVSRAVENQGWKVESITTEGETFRLEIRKAAK